MTTKKKKKNLIKENSEVQSTLTLGGYAYQIIDEQFRQIAKQEKKVLADDDPEHLHRMRVGTRRLRTALQVFGRAIQLPKAANEKSLRSLAQVLGKLRDLDVQTADLTHTYRPTVSQSEQTYLDKLTKTLKQQRRKAFAEVEDTFSRSRYLDLKTAYQTWLAQPKYTTLAQLPLRSLLPDLLSPLLAMLLLHPGWLVSTDDLSGENSVTLHDLRKAFKRVRYQTEFFTPFYGETFHTWIDEVKTIQDRLGKLQDTQVLQSLLTDELPNARLPELQAVIHTTQTEAMAEWETIRQKYLNPTFRYQLYHQILEPTPFNHSLQREPIANGAKVTQ